MHQTDKESDTQNILNTELHHVISNNAALMTSKVSDQNACKSHQPSSHIA